MLGLSVGRAYECFFSRRVMRWDGRDNRWGAGRPRRTRELSSIVSGVVGAIFVRNVVLVEPAVHLQGSTNQSELVEVAYLNGVKGVKAGNVCTNFRVLALCPPKNSWVLGGVGGLPRFDT